MNGIRMNTEEKKAVLWVTGARWGADNHCFYLGFVAAEGYSWLEE